MLSVRTDKWNKLTNLDNNLVTSCHFWSYSCENTVEEAMRLSLDDVEIPLPDVVSRQLQDALSFPKNQPHPDFCCIDLVNWLRGIYTESLLNRCAPQHYTLQPLSSLSKPVGHVGDTFLLYGKEVSVSPSVIPIHAFMQLDNDLYVWKPGKSGSVCFSTFEQLMDQYPESHYSNLSLSQMQWKTDLL